MTGRTIGDCGSNLGLEVMRGTVKDGDSKLIGVYVLPGNIPVEIEALVELKRGIE